MFNKVLILTSGQSLCCCTNDKGCMNMLATSDNLTWQLLVRQEPVA